MKKNTGSVSDRNYFILPFSAQTPSALKTVNDSFIHYLERSDIRIDDVSYSLCQSPKHFDYRNFLVGNSIDEIPNAFQPVHDPKDIAAKKSSRKSVVFLFSGQGSQYLNMGSDLYSAYVGFKKHIDECAEIVAKLLHEDIREILFDEGADNPDSSRKLSETKHAQPCIFSLEYSLARFWMDLGVIPAAMVGHSIGEFVAATVAGTISLKDALTLIVKRNDLWGRVQSGGMLSVPRGQAAVKSMLTGGLSIASVNSPFLTIVSGPNDELEQLKKAVESGGKICSYLPATHAFHSSMMDPIIPEFMAMFGQVSLSKPEIPILSTVTGDWLSDSEAMSPTHWADNVTKPVLFSQAISKILDETDHILLEVGPGATLTTLSKCHRDRRTPDRLALTSLRHSTEDIPDSKVLLTSAGKLWASGIEMNWNLLFQGGDYKRIGLPEFESRQDEAAVHTSSHDEEETSPRFDDDIHEVLVSLWKETLEIDSVDPDAGFYRLGGDSLLAMSLVNKLKRMYGLQNISISDILDNPTLEAQVGLLRRLQPASANDNAVETSLVSSRKEKEDLIRERKGPLKAYIDEFVDSKDEAEETRDIEIAPASVMQAMMWHLKHSSEQGIGYNMFRIYRLKGHLAPAILEQSINILFSHQKSFYTYFREKDSALYQVVLPPKHIELPLIDMKHLSQEETDGAIEDFLDVKFDMTKWPLFKLCLMEIADGEYLFCLVKEHIITDWYSMGVMYKQLSDIYNSLIEEKECVFEETKFQYNEYSVLQEHALKTGGYLSQLEYWKDRIRYTAEVRLPFDYARADASNSPVSPIIAKLPKEVRDSIKEFCHRCDVSLYVLLLTTFGILVQRLSGCKELNLGLIIAGRNNPDFENLIGILVNCIMTRFERDDEATFIDVLRNKRADLYNGYDNQDIPHRVVAEALSATMTPEKKFLSQFFFDMLSFNDDSFALNDVDAQTVPYEGGEHRSYSDMVIFVSDKVESLEIRFSYDIALFKKKTVETILKQYCQLLSLVSRDPDKRIADYSLGLPDDVRYLPDPTTPLGAGSDNARLLTPEPDHVGDQAALVDDSASLTFKEVEDIGRRLSSYLSSKGIRRGDTVFIFAERTSVLALTVIALIRMDCTFHVIDPAEEAEDRIRDKMRIARPGAAIFMKQTEISSVDEWIMSGSTSGIGVHLPGNPTTLCEMIGRFEPNVDDVKDTAVNGSYLSFESSAEQSLKAAVGSLRSIAAFVGNHAKHYELNKDYRYAMLSDLSGHRAIHDLLIPLHLGAPLFIPDSALVKSPNLTRWLEETAIDVISITPAIGRLLTRHPGGPIDAVRWIFSGGGRLDGELVVRLKEVFPHARIVNCYGTSETRRVLSYYEIPEDYYRDYADGRKGIIYIGQGTDTSQLLVLRNNRLAAVGEPGEIWVRSACQAEGYGGNADTRSIANPFTDDNADRIHKTGDIGRYTTDGYIELLG